MTPHDDPSLHRALSALPPPEAPATLTPRVMAAVRARHAGRAPLAPSGTHSPWVLAAAAAGLAVTVTARLWWPDAASYLPHGPGLPHAPSSVSHVAAMVHTTALTVRALYGAVSPWASAIAVVAALSCVPSLMLFERLTETRA